MYKLDTEQEVSWIDTNTEYIITGAHTSFSGNTEFEFGNLTNTTLKTEWQYVLSCCSKFNADLSYWDTSNATNMAYAFSNASRFNQFVSTLNTSNVTNMERMFQNASEKPNTFDTSK